jgi:segregation and condensation protein B
LRYADRALTTNPGDIVCGERRAGSGDEFRRFLLRRARAEPGGTRVSASGARSAPLARLETALFAAGAPLSLKRLCQFATLPGVAEARALLDALNAAYDVAGTAFRVERVAGGFQLLTRPELAPWLDRLHQRESDWKLSPPAMETLTIIAYRQPITRADVEAIRGVQCAEILKQLMDRGLVRIGGEDDSLGRPYLYETTRKFLETFGLRALDELPMAERLRKQNGPTSTGVFTSWSAIAAASG